VCVCVCGNIYTLNCRHVERMCSVKICKLICQSQIREGKGKKVGVEREKHTHTHTHTHTLSSLAKYSHRNLTLERLAAAPKSAVLHLKRRPLLFLGRDLLEEPERERQEENADSGSCFNRHTHTHCIHRV